MSSAGTKILFGKYEFNCKFWILAPLSGEMRHSAALRKNLSEANRCSGTLAGTVPAGFFAQRRLGGL